MGQLPSEAPSWVKPIMIILEKIWKAVSGGSQSEDKSKRQTRNFLVLKQAASQIGVKEIRGSKSNPIIDEYHDYSTKSNNSSWKDDVPWCASFVCWALEKVGMGSTNSARARSFEKWGVSKKSSPLPGDIVTFWRSSKSSGKGHVGFFIKKTSSHVVVLGGNQSDEVNISTYSTARMTDIRRSSKAGKYTKQEEQELYKLVDDILNGKKIKPGGKVV